MAVQDLKAHLKKYAPDIKRNLDLIFSEGKTPGLGEGQVWAVALGCGHILKNNELTQYIASYATQHLTEAKIEAIKSAVTIQSLRSCYNQSVLLTENEILAAKSPDLFEEVLDSAMGQTLDFHYVMLGCACINASKKCIQMEIDTIMQNGGDLDAIHSVIRIVSVLKGTSQALSLQ